MRRRCHRTADLGPDHIAETPVDDRVQIECVTDPQQVGRNDRADAAPRSALLAGAMLVTPKLLGEFRIGAAGPVVSNRMAGISGADQDDR